MRWRRALAAFAFYGLIAGCGGGSAYRTAPTNSPQVRTPFAATTIAGGETASLDGERFVTVRTLASFALSAEQLEAAGTATSGSATFSMARVRSGGVADWELVSASSDGWRVWRPGVVVDVLSEAAQDASLISVEAVQWPDSCLGVPRPGVFCASVVTPGYRIVLDDPRQGRIEYHTSRVAHVGPVAAP